MIVLSDKSFLSPRLVGRADPLAKLDDHLHRTRNGMGHVVLITGEAGIGKSRLLTEVKTSAISKSFLFAQCRCFELDQTVPFAPLIDMLRSLLALDAASDLQRSVMLNRLDFAKLLPELGSASQDAAPIPELDPEQEKRRLFNLLTQSFLRLASQHPLVLAIEDLHWSDPTSLDFLAYCARRMTQARILILITYRTEAASPDLPTFLAELERERIATEFVLSRLTRDETALLLQGGLGAESAISAEAIDSIYSLTEGNPFFVEEVIRSMIATGAIVYSEGIWRRTATELQLPRTVLVAVQQRLKLLSQPAHDLLVLAAVAGRRFDFTLLQDLTRQDEDTLIGLIKELIRARLVVEESAETFAFRHALTREAVYLSLLARERRRLHATMALAMERLYVSALETHSADLAYQFYRAEMWAKVLEYAPQAAEQAQSLYAPRAAISLYTQALEAAKRSGLAAPWSVHRGRAIAYETVGDFEAAHQDYAQALNIAGDAKLEWQSTLDLGFLWTGKDFQRAGEYLQQALILARAMDDPATLGHSLNRLGNWYQNHLEQPTMSVNYHREALLAFQTINDLKGIAASLDLLGTSSYFCGEILVGAQFCEEAIALFHRLNDRQGMLSSLVMRATRGANYLHETVICPVVDLASASQEAEAAVQLAHELDWRAGESFALSYLAFGLGAQGVYAPALLAAHQALELASSIQHDHWIAAAHLALGTLYLDLLDLPKAQAHLEQSLDLARRISTLFVLRMSSAFLASTYIRQHELTKANDLLDTALAQDQSLQTLARRRIGLARAELAHARGDYGTALQAIDQLVKPEIIPSLSLLRGTILLDLGQLEEAEVTLHQAEDSAHAHGLKPLLWRIHATLTRVYQAQGDPGGVTEELATTKAIINELAAGLSDQPEGAHFIEQALSRVRLPEVSPQQMALHYYDGLSRREREIATLSAQGRSNREIASQLVISERTVDTHMSNILSKLGFTSRRQIAQWAVEKGLTTNGS